MVNYKYMLMICADLENLSKLEPLGGFDDPNFSYFFKVKCGRCGELSQKEACVSIGDTVPNSLGKGITNLIKKCKFCGRVGTVTMIQGRGKPLTQKASVSGKYCPVMLFDCRGFEPVDFVFSDGWKVESAGTKYEGVDLSSGDFAEYDEKGECPVMISNLRSKFDVVK